MVCEVRGPTTTKRMMRRPKTKRIIHINLETPQVIYIDLDTPSTQQPRVDDQSQHASGQSTSLQPSTSQMEVSPLVIDQTGSQVVDESSMVIEQLPAAVNTSRLPSPQPSTSKQGEEQEKITLTKQLLFKELPMVNSAAEKSQTIDVVVKSPIFHDSPSKLIPESMEVDSTAKIDDGVEHGPLLPKCKGWECPYCAADMCSRVPHWESPLQRGGTRHVKRTADLRKVVRQLFRSKSRTSKKLPTSNKRKRASVATTSNSQQPSALPAASTHQPKLHKIKKTKSASVAHTTDSQQLSTSSVASTFYNQQPHNKLKRHNNSTVLISAATKKRKVLCELQQGSRYTKAYMEDVDDNDDEKLSPPKATTPMLWKLYHGKKDDEDEPPATASINN